MTAHRVDAVMALTAAALIGIGLAGCTVDPEPVGPSPSAATAAPSGSAETGSSDDPSAGGPVGEEQAGEIVTAKYGGRVLNVESDTNGAEEVWEVEVADSSEGRIEVDVSKATGEIVEFESDND